MVCSGCVEEVHTELLCVCVCTLLDTGLHEDVYITACCCAVSLLWLAVL